MNAIAILSLLGDLVAQIGQLTQENQQLRAQLEASAEAISKKEGVKP